VDPTAASHAERPPIMFLMHWKSSAVFAPWGEARPVFLHSSGETKTDIPPEPTPPFERRSRRAQEK
jgi:hypothetical protein